MEKRKVFTQTLRATSEKVREIPPLGLSYFDVEKGEGFDFQIAGNAQLYKLEPPAAEKKVSDRFSFTATQSQGNMYILTLRNTSGDKDVRISAFLEVVFPASGAIFIPLDTKK